MTKLKKETVAAPVLVKSKMLSLYTPKPARMVPLHPLTLEPMDTWIELAGMDSPEFRDMYMVLISKSREVKEDKTPEEELKAAMLQNCEMAGRSIVAWDEEQFGEFSVESAIEHMVSLHWLYVQVNRFIEDRANFYQA